MRLVGKNILLISPEPWNHVFVSKHHYAVYLGKRDNKVFYLNPPGSRLEVVKTSFVNVFNVHYKGFPKGLRFYPELFQRKIMLAVFKDLEALCSANFEVVWSFDNSVFFDFSFLPSSVLTISHIVDYNQNFRVKKSASTAGVCICTTEVIKRKLSLYNGNVFKINHGFNGTTGGSKIDSPGNRVRAVYSGNLAIRSIDWCILSEVVTMHPHVDFIFVGPNADVLNAARAFRTAKRKLLERPNARFVGAVRAADLQDFYRSADILLVAYQEKYQADQVANPHKLMEYLGSGKVVLATKTLEFMDFYPLIIMADRNQEWVDLFRSVVNNLHFYNASDLQAKRRAVAFDNEYESQILRIEKIVTQCVK